MTREGLILKPSTLVRIDEIACFKTENGDHFCARNLGWRCSQCGRFWWDDLDEKPTDVPGLSA